MAQFIPREHAIFSQIILYIIFPLYIPLDLIFDLKNYPPAYPLPIKIKKKLNFRYNISVIDFSFWVFHKKLPFRMRYSLSYGLVTFLPLG